MADEPSGTAPDEQRELEALRRRAYGPDADIFDDPDALARLTALEDRVRLERAPVRERSGCNGAPDERARPDASVPVQPALAASRSPW